MARYRRTLRWGVPVVLAAIAAMAVVASLPDGADESASSTTTAPGAGSQDPGGNVVTLPAADPAQAASTFLSAWESQDWEAFEAIIGSRADRATSDHASWWNDLSVSSLELTLETTTLQTDHAVSTYEVEVGIGTAGVWRYRAEVRLVPQGDGWVVSWMPTALHPSLGTGDHLEVVARWPDRALIADANGRVLVAEEPEVIVGVIAGRVESREVLAAALAEHVNVSRATLDAVLDAPGVQPDWYLPLTRVDRQTYVAVRPDLYPVPGVAFRVEEDRVPAFGTLGAELIGSTGEITAELLDLLGPPYAAGMVVGRSGLERSFESALAGTPTYEIVRRSASGDDVVVHGFPGAPGDTLVASIAVEAQRAAEVVVGESDLPTAIVAIDVATGEVRAAASNPSGGFNEALSGLYPPGSTFKIVVATALLEAGYATDDQVACPPTVTVSGKEFRNAADLPSTLSFEQAFARSCNTAFIQLGTSLDPGLLLDVAERYGFDVDYEIGLATAGGRFAPSGDPVDYAASMIGQGQVLASPLQMASVAATVASGEWLVPTMVVQAAADAAASFDPGVMADLRAMMRAVVAGGTGSAASILGRDVAGKTGTAEVGVGEAADTVAWFVGFADDLAFAVVVEGGSSGGGAAAPLARRFLLELDEAVDVVEITDGADTCVAAGEDWPTFQGSNRRTGCSDAAAITNPVLAWTATAGIQAWLNSPVIVGDTVVVGSAGSRRAGPDGADGVYAFDVDTGAERWRFATANDVNGIAVANGVVIVAGDEGAVWGVRAADGVELWRVDTGANVFGHPVVVDDLAVVGDSTGTLWGLGLEDGAQRWSVKFDGALRGGPASDGVLVYAASDLGDVRALNVDGFEIWSERIVFETNVGASLGVVYGSPTIVDDRLVVTFSVEGGPGSPGLVAFDRFVGSLEWWGSDPAGVSEARWANVRSSVAVSGLDLILAGSLSDGPQAIAAASGTAVWSATSGVVCDRQWASPVVVGGIVVLPRPDGAVYGFDAADGDVVWRLPLSAPGTLTPASGCATTDGTPIADGAEFQASAAVAPNGMVVVASSDQGIYAIMNSQ